MTTGLIADLAKTEVYLCIIQLTLNAFKCLRIGVGLSTFWRRTKLLGLAYSVSILRVSMWSSRGLYEELTGSADPQILSTPRC